MPVPTPTLRQLLPSTTPNPNLVFTPDDAILHTINGRIQLTDLNHGCTRTLPFEASRNLSSISLAKNRLLTTDTESRAAIFAPPFVRPFARLSLRFRNLTSAISPCATMAAFTGDLLQVWQVPTHPVPTFAAWSKLAEFAPGLSSSACLAWSLDSTRIAVGLSTGLVMMYTVQRGARTRGVHIKPLILHGHRSPIIGVRFVGKYGFVSLSEDGALFCWRLRYNDQLQSYSPKEYKFVKNNPARNPNRQQFIVPVSAKLVSRHFVKQAGAKRVRSCDVADPLLVVGLSNGVFALYELPEFMTREDEALDKGLFELGEAGSQKRKKRQAQQGPKRTKSGDLEMKDNVVQSDDEMAAEKYINEEDEEDEEDGGSYRIGFTDLTLLYTLSASGGGITRIAFSSKGAWIAMASAHSGQIIVWDWRAEMHVLKQQGHTLATEAMAFSPDGRAVATGSKDGCVKLWGVHSGFCMATFSNHEAVVSALTFSANDVIISASYDGTVRAFDIRRYRNFRIMVGPPPRRQFGCIAADSAGDLIAAGCVDTFEIIVWSLRTGQVLEVLNGHKGPVSGIAFRPLRGTLASSSWDRSIRLWDMYERKGSCEVLEHSKEVLAVCYRPDGRELAGCTTAGEIVMWGADSAKITGTIDGARDAAPGRRRESRTVAPQKGYFQSLCYSADGHFLIAGAASKHMCFFHVAEGRRPIMVCKIAVTQNQQFDGLLTKLNSKNLTDSGHALQEIDDHDEGAQDYGQARLSARKSLPGATAEEELQRKQLVQAEVRCVRACATGRLWGAVTQEGVLVYGDAASEEFGDTLFDPTHLDIDVTPKTARQAVLDENFVKALTIALRLNERDSLNFVVERVPVDQINLVVSQISLAYFSRLVTLFSWRLDHTPHLEFNLSWAKSILLVHGQAAREKAVDLASINSALRALNRACMAHSKRLTPIADQNESMLQYLLMLATRKETLNS